MHDAINLLSAQQLRRAADIKDKIESLQNELNGVIGASNSAPAGAAPKKKRTMSAAGRARIAAAQKARWAKAKETKMAAGSTKRPKRQMSAAARAKISAAAKARWAKWKAAK